SPARRAPAVSHLGISVRSHRLSGSNHLAVGSNSLGCETSNEHYDRIVPGSSSSLGVGGIFKGAAAGKSNLHPAWFARLSDLVPATSPRSGRQKSSWRVAKCISVARFTGSNQSATEPGTKVLGYFQASAPRASETISLGLDMKHFNASLSLIFLLSF